MAKDDLYIAYIALVTHLAAADIEINIGDKKTIFITYRNLSNKNFFKRGGINKKTLNITKYKLAWLFSFI